MRAALVLDDLGDRALRLVVLRVRALDRRGHEVILAARDEEQRRPVGVLVVDAVVGPRMDVRERTAPEHAARRDVVTLVEPSRSPR